MNHVATLLAGTALLVGSGPVWAGEPTQPSPAGAGPQTSVVVPAPIFVIDAQGLTEERVRNKVVAATREALARSGTTPLYAPKATAELALREAAVEALHKNLDIKRSGLAKAMVDRALNEADAVFDPVLVASFNAALSATFKRVVQANKYKTATQTLQIGQTDSNGVFTCTSGVNGSATWTQTYGSGKPECYVITLPKSSRANIISQQFLYPRPEGYAPSTVTANDFPTSTPPNTAVYDGAISFFQQLPWGPSLNLSLDTRRQNTWYQVNVFNGLGPTLDAYNRPYYSTITLGGVLPLPYTKNFGPTAAGDLGVDLALQNIDAAALDVRTVINSTLLQVDTLYWQLVGAIGSLEAADQSLTLAEKQRGSVQRLFDQGFVTESDRNQVEAQVSGVRVQQQQLFGAYVKTSEAMRKLLNSDQDALLLPVGYQALMKRPAGDLTEISRVLDNPAYQRQAVAVRIATLWRTAREAQTRPDITLTANVRMAEAGTFGYSDITASVARAFTSQDNFTATLALLYQRPIGGLGLFEDRAAQAALDASEHVLTQQAIALHQVELATRESFETARGQLASARERIRIAERSVKLAQEVYDQALQQQELGLVAAYETIARLSSLLSARTQLVQAQVDQRTAETLLLASVGGLAERYGDLTAQTGVDRARLALLHDSGALKHFGGPL